MQYHLSGATRSLILDLSFTLTKPLPLILFHRAARRKFVFMNLKRLELLSYKMKTSAVPMNLSILRIAPLLLLNDPPTETSRDKSAAKKCQLLHSDVK